MNSIWLDEDARYKKFAEGIRIPDSELRDVDCISVTRLEDLDKIPTGGGCYWIWTNEPIKHFLHRNKLPDKLDGGEIIYNGIAKDDIRGRVIHHLFGNEDEGWSGVSVDLYIGRSASHRKKAMSQEGKRVAYYNSNPLGYPPSLELIRSKEQLALINLSKSERDYVQNASEQVFYFRNGINISDEKHFKNEFRVYYIVGITSLYLEHIEKEWRKHYGLPRLCSYTSGR
jgi:hypothetical protein